MSAACSHLPESVRAFPSYRWGEVRLAPGYTPTEQEVRP